MFVVGNILYDWADRQGEVFVNIGKRNLDIGVRYIYVMYES